MNMKSYWDIASCSLIKVVRRFRGAYCLHHENDHTDDGGSKHL
jgi:hypothetical protein